MAAKIAAFFITFLINIAIGVVIFFFMLIAMNGFSESDAEKGLIAYAILAFFVSILMSISAVLLAGYLLKKGFSGVVATLIAVPIFSLVGGALKVVCSIIGIAIAEYVRVNY
jgi:hypothetical protein